jgi:hypothetical protein
VKRGAGETPALRQVWAAVHVEEGKGDSLELYFLGNKPAPHQSWHGLPDSFRHRRVSRGKPGRHVLDFSLSQDVMWLVSQKMLEDLAAGWQVQTGGGEREGHWKALRIAGPIPMLRFLSTFPSQSAQARRSAEKSNTFIVRLGHSENAPRLVLSFYQSNVTESAEAVRKNQELHVGAPLAPLDIPADLDAGAAR